MKASCILFYFLILFLIRVSSALHPLMIRIWFVDTADNRRNKAESARMWKKVIMGKDPSPDYLNPSTTHP
jgi:hypothetical protein